ncbi:MAG: family 1 glycosylhydrolase [Deltaproteobacteria bacterium]|nr:family 1 glycosylhydrolase [Deltaproteobacteria bacterium]
MTRALAAPALALALAACGDSGPTDITFPAMGSISAPSGKGSFRFGVATAATQIEDMNPNTDWYLWTKPTADGGLGRGAFVGDASDGYTLAVADIQLLKDMHVDVYRFSIEWARIEPVKGQIDQAALDHYGEVLDNLRTAGIKPVVTIHHFSNPVWVDDPRDTNCAAGPTDTNLCGLGHPTGGPMVIAAMAAHAGLLAEKFGDRVDEWGTLNEPVNYLLAAYGVGQFPPGKSKMFSDLLADFVPVVRDYIAAHAAMYDAIKAHDTIDADGDGVAASVGLSLSVADWVASQDNEISTDPMDTAARDKVVYVFHHLFIDSIVNGNFDANLDGTPDEQQPTWTGKLDWLGVQYYFRTGVSGHRGLVPVLKLTPCFSGFDVGSCLPPIDNTFCVPTMGYEAYAPGIYDILKDMGARYPNLPLVVSEAGIATSTGERRAENVVRILEEIDHARRDGVDVRGYYHWSLYDNFEWAEGFVPRFGLYTVDFASGARTPTLGATVLGTIASTRTLTAAQRGQYGGTGPMTPEPGVDPAQNNCQALKQ